MFDCCRWCSCWHLGFRAAELVNPRTDLEANITREAILCLEKAIRALGDRPTQGGFRDKMNSDVIKDVICLLRTPSAKDAADAFIMMGQVADSCDTEAEGNVKAAQRVVADVVVLRCRSVSEPPGTKEAFIRAAEEAFGRRRGDLDRGLENLLLLAWIKLRRRA